MQMRYGLSRVGAAVADHTVTVIKTLCLGNLGNDFENVRDHSAVLSGDSVAAVHVGLGDHQNVGGSLGSDVPEGQHGFVLIHLGGGDHTGCDFTK